MFNGIIYNQGIVSKILKKNNFYIIEIKSKFKISKKEIGSSICCNGVCLTLTKIKGYLLIFFISNETIKKSNFKHIKVRDLINLEKSLKYGDKISGHYVQGHVDCTSKIMGVKLIGKSWIFSLSINEKFSKYLVEKASITINGISLTIAKKNKNMFEVNIIPHTYKNTNLNKVKKGNIVNIELDIFSKYLTNISI